MTDERYSFGPIGVVHSCYKEKFGVPRQPGLVPVTASIELRGEYAQTEAWRGLEQFSHIWVIFVFHQTQREHWKPTVRPPRLGGNRRVGVFASRSMYRPNAIGLSVVELLDVRQTAGKTELSIRGGDFIDGTPILDIKPYLPYVDAVTAARGGYADSAPTAQLPVRFTDAALAVIHHVEDSIPGLHATLVAILRQDPRPSYQAESNAKTEYAMRLYDFDVKWRVEPDGILVYGLETIQL